jgi:hypothetical protein
LIAVRAHFKLPPLFGGGNAFSGKIFGWPTLGYEGTVHAQASDHGSGGGRKRSEPDAAPSCYDVTATKALRVGAGLSAILHALAGFLITTEMYRRPQAARSPAL